MQIQWKGTSLGFDNIAAARNDGLLVLDEIGQARSHVVSDTVYSVMNGVGKIQGAKDGGNRPFQRWRVLVLSTGERTPAQIVEKHDKGDWNAGQAVRLPSIDADAGNGHGIYDTLHGFKNGALLSEHISSQAAKYYGTAGRAFIQLLQQTPIETIQAAYNDFLNDYAHLDGQARTVAKRFALLSAALD